MKKLSSIIILSLLVLAQSSYAAEIASFVVQVSPSSASVNQAMDLTVKAVDANGAVVKDANNTFMIEVPDIKDFYDAVIPSDGYYTLSPQDQGEKTFSKGLVIKKPGTYTVSVYDIVKDSINGKATVTILSGAQATNAAKITFSSPLEGATETSDAIGVIGNAGVKNATVQIAIDGAKVKEAMANENGDFTSFLSDVAQGQHVLSAEVVDISNAVIAQSSKITFMYQPTVVSSSGVKVDITPSKTLKQGQKATFALTFSDKVSNVVLTLNEAAGKKIQLPLDSAGNGLFQKSLLMDEKGTYTLDVSYANAKEKKTETAISTLSVLEGKGIKEVTYVINPTNKDTLELAWKPIGTVENVLVKYGEEKDTLTTTEVLTGTSGTINGLDLGNKQYFVRIFPADANGEILGEPSDIILVEPTQGSAPVCRVNGIMVTTKKIGDQYFLVWKAAENAERYIVYRSDRPVSSVAEMQKVGETSDVKFPYPFDPNAQTESYAYYAVVAVCQDGTALQLGGTKKIKVGPMTNIMILLLFSMMIYGIYRMRKISHN